jgi:hypothetical protein
MKDLADSPAHTTAVGLLLRGSDQIETVPQRENKFFRRLALKMENIMNEFI